MINICITTWWTQQGKYIAENCHLKCIHDRITSAQTSHNSHILINRSKNEDSSFVCQPSWKNMIAKASA